MEETKITQSSGGTVKKKSSVKAKVQAFGSKLSGMVMPNIGAFIAWGLITAIFMKGGWLPNAQLAKMTQPMVTYLLPLLIGYTGGTLLDDQRGGVVGAIATMGVIVGANIPMFIGAMIMGPLGGWCMKKWDEWAQPKIKQGFEMLVNNFSAGIIGMLLAIVAFYTIGPIVTILSGWLAVGVNTIIRWGLLPLANVFIEPAKILFLNNAINQGILTPLGIQAAANTGKSILFLLEPNPGPGLGILLAFALFGKGTAKASAPSAIIIHFFGGIHEIYFPYVLMKPALFLAVIAGGVTGTATFSLFGAGLKASPSPGSIISILLMTPKGLNNFIGILLGVTLATIASFLVAAIILRRDKSPEGNLDESTAKMAALKGAATATGNPEDTEIEVDNHLHSDLIKHPDNINHIIFACDAGMGSSAMGASILRDKVKKAGLKISVTNTAISKLQDEQGLLVVTQNELADRAAQKAPNAVRIAVDNFLNSPKYDQIVTGLKTKEVAKDDEETTAQIKENEQAAKDPLDKVDLSVVKEFVFVHHDQNLGSATMAASTFRNKLQKANIDIPIKNLAVGELDDTNQILVIASKDTANRLKFQFNQLQIVSVDNVLTTNVYDEIISKLS